MDLNEKLEQLTQITAALTNEVIELKGKDLSTKVSELEQEHKQLKNDIEDLRKCLSEQQQKILSLVKQQSGKFERTIKATKTTPHLVFNQKICKYSKMFPIKTPSDLDAMEKLISEDNVTELVAAVQQLLMPQGIIKNIASVLSIECINAYNLDGHHRKRRLLDKEKFMDMLFRAAYYEGYSQKLFLEEVRQGLKMVKNRYNKNIGRRRRLQQLKAMEREEQEQNAEVTDIQVEIIETEEEQDEESSGNQEDGEEITDNREIFIKTEQYQDEGISDYLKKFIKTEKDQDEEITDNMVGYIKTEKYQDEETTDNLNKYIKTEEISYE